MKTAVELRGELAELTRWRTSEIARINAEFDARALELNREIERVDPTHVCEHCGYKYGHRLDCRAVRQPEPATPARRARRRSTFTLQGTEGWSEEDIAHFRELQAQKV